MSNVNEQTVVNRASGGRWIPALLIANLALVLGFGYASYSAKNAMGDRIAALEASTQQAQAETVKKLVNGI